MNVWHTLTQIATMQSIWPTFRHFEIYAGLTGPVAILHSRLPH